MNVNTETLLNYHQRTKHRLERYANGPANIDWDDQPNQFRYFKGCETLRLPAPGQELGVLFRDLDQPSANPNQPVSLANVGLLLELAFGLSAWKQYDGNRWALRCNPSSGNLHPTEAYLISAGHDCISPGVYHYLSHDHALERRAQFVEPVVATDLLVGLSSVHWREAWKYGERAFRYCQHDIGHAIGALRYAAATLGWSVELLAEWSDDAVAQWLGLDRSDDFLPEEQEYPDLMCRIHTQTTHAAGLTQLPASVWHGKAESLGARHFYQWSVIETATAAAHKPHTQEPAWLAPALPKLPSTCLQTAASLIRQRRSAQQFDGTMAAMPLAAFYRIMSAVLPSSLAPFDVWQWHAKVHLLLFVHRVEGIVPGVYALPRSAAALAGLQQALLQDFDWQAISDSVPLYHLYTGDCRRIAKTLSCHQAIASDSAFSVAMVAEFADTVKDAPWQYRRLFWECGLIGQVLYLEAEAAGYRGTGIGCYFDDSVHEILGISDGQLQSLYHFTIGQPLEDARLQTLPAYGHLPPD
ncbi:MAG: nitroreductase [Methylococcaceae bacterium]|nr:nitroreductase [Methylococcaceae bacterium]